MGPHIAGIKHQTPNLWQFFFEKKWPFGPCFEVSFPGRVKVGKGGARFDMIAQLNSSIWPIIKRIFFFKSAINPYI